MRWVRKNSLITERACCTLCGTGYGGYNAARMCPHTVCLACGSEQCLYNGLGNGACSICLTGILAGWGSSDRKCGYAGCTKQAIARAPRVRFVCKDHSQTAPARRWQERKVTVAEDIALALEVRPHVWKEVEDAGSQLAMCVNELLAKVREGDV